MVKADISLRFLPEDTLSAGICKSQISVCITVYVSELLNIFLQCVQTPSEGNQSHRSETHKYSLFLVSVWLSWDITYLLLNYLWCYSSIANVLTTLEFIIMKNWKVTEHIMCFYAPFRDEFIWNSLYHNITPGNLIQMMLQNQPATNSIEITQIFDPTLAEKHLLYQTDIL